MTDILKHLSVDVHCDQCGDFTVGAHVIAESQRLLAQGCDGSPYECAPSLFAPLLDGSAMAALERAWGELKRGTRRPVRQVVIPDALRVEVVPSGKADPGALSRWEDDGGYIPRAGRDLRGHARP